MRRALLTDPSTVSHKRVFLSLKYARKLRFASLSTAARLVQVPGRELRSFAARPAALDKRPAASMVFPYGGPLSMRIASNTSCSATNFRARSNHTVSGSVKHDIMEEYTFTHASYAPGWKCAFKTNGFDFVYSSVSCKRDVNRLVCVLLDRDKALSQTSPTETDFNADCST